MRNKKNMKNIQNGEATNAVPNKEFLGSNSQKDDKHKRRKVMLVRKIMVIIMIAIFAMTTAPAMAEVLTPPSDGDGFVPAAADDNSVITPSIADDAITLAKIGTNGATTNGQLIVWSQDNLQWEIGTPAGVAADSITLAEMAGSTRGDIITYDAAGDPIYRSVSSGSAHDVLTLNAAGNDWEYAPLDSDNIDIAEGAILIGDGSGDATELAAGAANTILTSNGTTVSYQMIDENFISGTADIPFSSLADLNRGNVLIGNASNEAAAVDVSAAGTLIKGDGTDALAFARGTADQVLKVNAGGTDIEYGTIGSASITNNSIASVDILDGTITGTDIGTGTVTSTNITDGTITGTDIGTGTVTSTNITDGTITGTDIAAGTVTSTNITDGTIVGGDINATLLNQITLWETSANGTFEDDQEVRVGSDAAMTYVAGAGAGDLSVQDDAEIGDDLYVGGDSFHGASTSATETIDDAGFVMDGDDSFFADDVGIEGDLYVDGNLNLNNPIVSTATVTKNMFVDLHAAVRNSAPIGTLSGGLTPAIKFNNANQSTAIWTFPVPDDYSTGDMNVKITWVTGGTDAGNVGWDHSYRVYDPTAGVDMTSAMTDPATVTAAGPGTANESTETTLAIASGDLANDRNVILTIQRPAGDANADDASIIGVEIEYTAEQIQAN